MKIRNISTLIGAATAAVCVSLATTPAAQAQVLGSNWSYTMDSFADGNDGNTGVGKNSHYEMYGMAMKAQDGIISIAFNANLALAGQAHGGVTNGTIGWGDVLFNFSGKSLKDASAAGQLFGIRFAGSNDSGAATTGVFSSVTAKSVAQQNSGFSTFSQYQNDVNNNSPNTNTGTKGGQIGYGGATVAEAKDYLTNVNGVSNDSSYGQLNVIGSGTKVGDINFLGAAEIASLASGFAGLGGIGSHTVGFSFSQSLLGQFLQPANAVITLLEECTNDGMMLKATLPSTLPPADESVPEPMTMLGMALGGLGLVKGKMNQRRTARVNVNG